VSVNFWKKDGGCHLAAAGAKTSKTKSNTIRTMSRPACDVFDLDKI
jgi:hypothetical protein